MPRNDHYHQAAKFIGDLLGSDAADERDAYCKSIEQLAVLFQASEAYQDAHCEPPTAGSNLPRQNSNRAA